jgi:hypothetical protein
MWRQIAALGRLTAAAAFRSPRRLLRHHLCWHHDYKTGITYISSSLVDAGRNKIFWCTRCQKSWMLDDLLRGS